MRQKALINQDDLIPVTIEPDGSKMPGSLTGSHVHAREVSRPNKSVNNAFAADPRFTRGLAGLARRLYANYPLDFALQS